MVSRPNILKDEVYRQKPATLNALREIIEASCAAITPDTLTAVVRSAIGRHRRCLAADGGHFVPKLLTIKGSVHFFRPLCILLRPCYDSISLS
jgi:hypothetical protein